MTAILALAGRDFRANMFSLRGASIMFFFLIILGAFFQSFVYTFVEMSSSAPSMGASPPNLDQLVQATCHNLNFILLMALPAVTMASFSEERKTKSLRLLQTAPIGAFEIVMGKFFACFMVLSVVLVGSFVYMGFIAAYGKPDFGLMASSYLGLFLLVASHVAFGIFVSSMTSHQFLAFIFTLGGLFFMLILNWIAPNIASDTGVQGFVKYLASTTHLDPFFKGVISVGDVSYFLLMTVLFLFLSAQVIDSQRWR